MSKRDGLPQISALLGIAQSVQPYAQTPDLDIAQANAQYQIYYQECQGLPLFFVMGVKKFGQD
jgi:hypothetical protein